MSRLALPLSVLGVAFALMVPAGSAQAQATRTWVSGVGDDANPCSRTAPCKTFAGAISKTAAGGEINCLDPGGFGGVTITKSLTISCEAGTAGVLVSGTNAVIVNAGVNDRVTLRGLDFEGLGTGLSGIAFLAGAHLHVQNCVIRAFRGTGGNGIRFQPSTVAKMDVTDTVITDNTTGVLVQPTGSGTARVTLNRVLAASNTTGIKADSTGAAAANPVHVTMRDSVATGNTDGVVVQTGGQTSFVTIENSALTSNSASGVSSTGGANALAVIDRNVISGNGTGISPSAGGQILTFQNNAVATNFTADGTPTGNVAPK